MSTLSRFLFLAFLLLPHSEVEARSYKFVKVADTTTRFAGFNGVAISPTGTVAFVAQLTAGNYALCTGNGGPVRILLQSGATTKFKVGFGGLTVNASGTIAFAGYLDDQGGHGLYLVSPGGAVTTVCDTVDPARTVVPTASAIPAINSAGEVAFVGTDLNVYLYSRGTLRSVVQPGTGNAYWETVFDRVGLADNDIVQLVADVNGGHQYYDRNIYLADTSASMPMLIESTGNGQFTGIGPVSFSRTGVATFAGFLNDGSKVIYKGSSDSLAPVIGTGGSFASLTAPMINGAGEVVYSADLANGHTALLDGVDPVRNLVLQNGDPLFGGFVQRFSYDDNALGEGGQIVFTYHLGNGVDGIALAIPDGPDPGGGLIKAAASQGIAVPGAGDPGSPLATGTQWLDFGPPAVNLSGELAFQAKLQLPRGVAGPKSGIFTLSGTTLTPIAVVGGDVPELAGLTFATFKDPLLADDGSLLFSATIAGPQVTAATSTVWCWYDPAHSASRLVARIGEPLTAAGGATLSKIAGAALLPGGQVALDGFLTVNRTLKITTANDEFAGTWTTASGLRIGLREGQPLAGSTVKSFLFLKAALTENGQDRGWFGIPAGQTEAQLGVVVTLVNGGQVVLGRVRASDASFTALVGTGLAGPGLPTDPAGSYFTSVGLPMFGWGNASPVTFRGTLSDRSMALFQYSASNLKSVPLVKIGAPVAHLTNSTVATLSDPVAGPDGAQVMWKGAVQVPGPRNSLATLSALLLVQADGSVTQVAAAGGQPPGVPAGAKWLSFSSVANAGHADASVPRGPLLLAAMSRNAGGVTTAGDSALWGYDSSGSLRLLLREGEPIESATVRSFTLLNAVSGAPGVGRSASAGGRVAVRVVDSHSLVHVATIDIP